ncbi:YncE family protein [Streptomyces angustmyceticus]|uniref:YncE family protein n=1 Tax=Streptomyces angustmyceticus TaxID=285578 RepID=UPI0021AFDD61|nr:YncE family protein [Streptomyces angustmyceticus]
MTALAHRIRRTTALAVSLAVGGTLTLAGTATAHSGNPCGPAARSAPVAKGLFQTAYSERNHALWATSSVGEPPVTHSRLVKLDPHTLEVEATYRPPVTDPETGAVEAVYGIAVDDAHHTVWTTNTRDNSVGVYSQRTGKRLATQPGVRHAREVVVDEKHHLAWASSFADGSVIAFDTRTYQEKKRITLAGSSPAGMAVDERTGTAYATDFANDRIIQIAPHATTPRLIPTGDSPLSIALSRDGRTAYTADQAAGTVSVINLRRGAVTRTVPTGAGAKSVSTDPRSGRILVANRTTATVTVVDPHQGTVVDTLTTGALTNHVHVAHGAAFVATKSASGPNGEDLLHRFPLGR